MDQFLESPTQRSTVEAARMGRALVSAKEIQSQGSLGGSAVWCLPLAQGVILESRDRVPCQAPGMEPASPSACVSASLYVYHE